jgi:RHS repeat-associated protein
MTSGPLPTVPNANSTLTWDAENRLISTTVAGTATTYKYDAQSRRIAKIAGTTTTSAATLYLYDAWNCIAEYERGTGVSPVLILKKTRLWGTDLSGSMQGAGGVGGLLLITDHSTPITSHYPTYDGNGNISEYLTATGTTAAHFEYDPFGNTVVNTDTANLFTYRFSTKPRDQETGLYYYGYRYYDPMTGRWLSRDPIEEKGGENLYGFVGCDGVNEWDFLGLTKVEDGPRAGSFEVQFGLASVSVNPDLSVTGECDENGPTISGETLTVNGNTSTAGGAKVGNAGLAYSWSVSFSALKELSRSTSGKTLTVKFQVTPTGKLTRTFGLFTTDTTITFTEIKFELSCTCTDED